MTSEVRDILAARVRTAKARVSGLWVASLLPLI